jgi:hypothetical protein
MLFYAQRYEGRNQRAHEQVLVLRPYYFLNPLTGYNPDNCQWITLEENSAKSQAEREKSPLNTTGEHHISWNSYKSKYEVTVNHTYVGNYNTIEAAVIERDWFINNHNLQHLAK